MDEAVHLPAIDENTRTTNRMSARNPRTEILLRGERRRSWTADQKSQIVAESLGPELTPTEVARKHGISTGQLYTWGSRAEFVGDLGPIRSPASWWCGAT